MALLAEDDLRSWAEGGIAALKAHQEKLDENDPGRLTVQGGITTFEKVLDKLKDFRVEPKTRRKYHSDDPDTSVSAAQRGAMDSKLTRKILKHLDDHKDNPNLFLRTNHGIRLFFEDEGEKYADDLIVARRMSDLKGAGVVRDSGLRHTDEKGSSRTVWERV